MTSVQALAFIGSDTLGASIPSALTGRRLRPATGSGGALNMFIRPRPWSWSKVSWSWRRK
jgi:hypothetical protein